MPMNIVHLLIGLVVLLFGRKLFWLFVGYVGFVAGFYYTTQVLTMEPGLLVLLVALGIGILGAVLAIFLQHVAILVSGFLAGGYLAIHLFNALGANTTQLVWLLQLIGGIIGATVLWAIFDYALIVLSSVVGASTIITTKMLGSPLDLILFCLLVVLGIIVQTRLFRKETQASGT